MILVDWWTSLPVAARPAVQQQASLPAIAAVRRTAIASVIAPAERVARRAPNVRCSL